MEQVIEFATNHYILAGLFVALLVALLYSTVAGSFSKLKELSTHEATLLMNKEDAVVLDIRPVAEFKKGHILGAKQIKAEQVTKGDFTGLEKQKDKPIIVVCAMGMTCKRTANQMLKEGFEQVSVLKGGMNAWQGASLPISK
ncbi:rhodanese-like domain-containing protein [Paraglaciecola chathamensis]|uniref:Rhodanese domain protein n=1 Tax=Paraglaciecola chathamensis S18K6 TaxID=1127672 RepID=A0AAV3UUF3_9ALTE|nr:MULTISPECIES: rhodanese-like domain-containing protein [Paraglaciecola]AEE24535.1 Rhodanese domain protein [Glaciecola sp. 4H-3-7+YE-5]MBN23876.1 rhodanese-like domain-containing protein [Alteromonadaceae bacterium]GAC08550.1 rhodanese domain protein [Paraglaciecola chathamensis S18K6]|tara:strand:- start:62371 stop:62796 length:426 start_codon:yes stop_codon:yes gene_type:complete